MFERIIHFTVPQRPNQHQLAAIERARSLHPSWKVKVWADPVDVSGHRLAAYHTKANSGAQLADLIRLDVVNLFGGIYLDSDIELCRPLDALCILDNFFCSEDGVNLTNAAFGVSRRQHPLLTALIEELLAHEPDWTRAPNETTGPQLFARVLHGRRDARLLPRDTFYPYNWNEKPAVAVPTTYGTHRWAASWKVGKWSGSDVSARFREWFDWRGRTKRALRRVLNQTAGPILDTRLAAVPMQYPFGPELVIKTRRGVRMSLPGGDLTETPELVLTGTANEPAQKFIERSVKGGDFVLDVGSGVGAAMLVAASRVGPFGRVFSIEPSTDLQAHLQRDLEMNGWADRIELLCPCQSPDARETADIASPELDDLLSVNAEFKLARWSAMRWPDQDFGLLSRLLRSSSAAYILVDVPSDPELCRVVWRSVTEVMGSSPNYVLRMLDEDGELVDHDRPAFGRHRNIVLCRCTETDL